MTDENQRPAWERSALEVIITETYEATVVGEEGENYLVEFADYDGGMVEAKMKKKRFENFPHPIDEIEEREIYFTIVVYKIDGKRKAGAWPIPMYWNPELSKPEECKLAKEIMQEAGLKEREESE